MVPVLQPEPHSRSTTTHTGCFKVPHLASKFVARMWHLSVINHVIPSPADSGWVLSEGKLSAHMTDNLPAPLAIVVIDLLRSNFSSTKFMLVGIADYYFTLPYLC